MKKTLPPREIEICDCCHREMGYLETCKFCGSQYCLSCRAIISGCAHQVDVCRKCENNETLLAIVEKHASLIFAALRARDAEINEAFQHRVEPTISNAGKIPQHKPTNYIGGSEL